ncbi:MAG: TonB-dependent receptor, partial [Methylocystaceae bacterium]
MFSHYLQRGASAGAIAIALMSVPGQAQEALPTIDVGATRPSEAPSSTSVAPGFDPARAKEPIYRDPPGQTVTQIKSDFLSSTPLSTVQEILRYSPGVSFSQGLTPRDLIVSIRGSGNRLSNGVRNILMFDDGFPIVT